MLSQLKRNQKQIGIKIGRKLKTAGLNSRFTGLKIVRVLRLVYFRKILKSNVTVDIYVYPPTTSRALHHIQKIAV